MAIDLRPYFASASFSRQQFEILSRLVRALEGETYLFADLPAATPARERDRAFVSDASTTTFASVVAGGGANYVPVYCDGADWRIG